MRWISTLGGVKSTLRGIKRMMERKEISSTFDTYNSEANSLTVLQSYSGVRSEISKTLSPFLQISRLDILDKDTHTIQMFSTLSFRNSLLQLGIDHESNMRFKAMSVNGNVISRIHTIVTGGKEVFNQLEVEVKNKLNHLGLKLITPAIKSTEMIYVMNILQQFGSLSVGAEVIKADCEVGISVCGRYEHKNGIFSVGLQQFTALTLNYYHRLNKWFDFGTELQVSGSSPSSMAIGCRLLTPRSQVRASVNTNMSLGFSLDERLTEGLSFNLNAEINRSGCSHGYGFSFEF